MSWRGSASIKDRVLASLPYILPLIEVYALGIFLYQDFPILRTLYIPLYPVMAIYAYLSLFIPYFGLVVFLALYLLIVRNERFLHFLRFNTMQALMLGIFSSLCQAILELLGLLRIPNVYNLLVSPVIPNISAPFIIEIVIDTVFLAVVVGSLYSIVQALRGLYAEIPVISEAAYAQTR
ncbi:MAG TPA: Tic20 family protein [Leptolyngbyaceae cyanobacterium]